MKKIYLCLSLLFCCASSVFAQPTTAATTPPVRNTTDVVSLYSGAYTNLGGTDFYPGWGQSTTINEFYVGLDTMIQYGNFNYQGIQLASNTDVSNMTKLHIDLWTSNCTQFEVFLINTTPAPSVEQSVTLTPTLNGWNSFDIDLSLYTNIALHKIGQLKFVSTPFGGTPGPTVYLDNIYFYKSATTPTITNFNIPAKNMGNAPFFIASPTSNSAGAFTYTSSNTSVATVSNGIITIVGVGNTTIKATQAASGAYGVGTISTTFIVNTGLANAPTTAAPTPTKAQANVISLFSNAYTNVNVDTWSAGWDQADVADTIIMGNDTKKYSNLVYSGIEFTGANKINVTNADFFHVDIWTPNASSFKVKLVDFGANGVFGGGDDKEHEYTCNNPAFSSWVSYDIPMSAFTGLTTKANLAQMLFVSSGSTVYFDNVFFWANTAVLPVSIKSFTANKKENNVLLSWSVSNEISVANYEIQSSVDGRNFETIGFVKATNSNTYSFVDTKPSTYYRLKINDNNGKFSYSEVRVINTKLETLNVSVYPNPAKNNVVINNLMGNNNISIVNAFGQTVLQKSNITATNTTIDIAALQNGYYTIIINNNEGKKAIKLLIQK